MAEDLTIDQIDHRVEGIGKHIRLIIEEIRPKYQQLTRLQTEQMRLNRLRHSMNGKQVAKVDADT